MEGELKERIAANESVLRNINERIESGQWPGEEQKALGFRCECARLGCNGMVELTVEQYEEVRSHPRRFVVLPGHQIPAAEDVVKTEPGYVVVEKRDQAGEMAEANDPRG
jgi:hypothetical protein